MARAIWTGSISFGLVNVPVRLYSATETKDVRFHQVRAETNERIRYKRVGEETGDEVPYDEIVKGYEVGKGSFVTITPEELEAVEPGQTKTIDIEDFVALDDIDPIYFEKAYYIGPAGKAGAEKPYELLRRVLEQTGKVGIARFVMRSKQYLTVIRPTNGVLLLETLFFADEVRPSDVVENKPESLDLSDRELAVAEQLIESLTSEWEPERYHDTYRERVLDLVSRKAEGETISLERAEQPSNVVDLMAALEASVQAAREGRPTGAVRRRDAGSDGSTTAGEVSGRATVELEEKKVDELRDLAREQGIRGRSKMNRDELLDALREAS